MSTLDRNRLDRRFAALKAEGRAALVTYISAGDPDAETFRQVLHGLPDAGADVIELGVPFTDPAADGPAIQAAGLRALKAGASLRATLAAVAEFRRQDDTTPIVLMGYYNPIYIYGAQAFATAAAEAGVDGLITVDLPPEEEAELADPARAAGIHTVRLLSPTTRGDRLPYLLRDAGGFLYYVSIAGITGTREIDVEPVAKAVADIRAETDLPVAVGFGIRTPESAAAVAAVAEGVVVGSAIVQKIADGLDDTGRATPALVPGVLGFVAELSAAVRGVSRP